MGECNGTADDSAVPLHCAPDACKMECAEGKLMAVKQNHRIVYPVLSILFPCLLGMVGMIHGNVSGSIWMQNAAAILLLRFFGCVLCVMKTNFLDIVPRFGRV